MVHSDPLRINAAAATGLWIGGRRGRQRGRPGAGRRRRSLGGECRWRRVCRRDRPVPRGVGENARVWIGGRWGRRRKAGSSGGPPRGGQGPGGGAAPRGGFPRASAPCFLPTRATVEPGASHCGG